MRGGVESKRLIINNYQSFAFWVFHFRQPFSEGKRLFFGEGYYPLCYTQNRLTKLACVIMRTNEFGINAVRRRDRQHSTA